MTTAQGDDVDRLVRGFARLLASAWPEVVSASELSSTGSFLADWLQANWEAFVEGALAPGVFLEVYGEGADLYGKSSRVYQPSASATHAITCLPRDGARAVRDLLSGDDIADRAGLPLEELVSLDGSWYARRPPFDCVLVERDQRTYVFAMADIRFSLGPATRG